MKNFYEIYNLFPEQITQDIQTKLQTLVYKDSWSETMEVLAEHPDMYLTAVNCIVYGA